MVDHGGVGIQVGIQVQFQGPAGGAVQQETRNVVAQELRQRYQPVFEGIVNRAWANCQGQSVEAITAALRQEVQAENDLTMSDAELSNLAADLAAGDRTVTISMPGPEGL